MKCFRGHVDSRWRYRNAMRIMEKCQHTIQSNIKNRYTAC